MKIRLLLTLCLSVLLLQNCAPRAVKITPVPSSFQKVGPDKSLTSQKKHTVTISHYTNIEMAKGKTMFRIIIENRKKDPVEIKEGNISVYLERNNEEWSKKLKIQQSDEFKNDLERGYIIMEYAPIIGALEVTKDILDKLERDPRVGKEGIEKAMEAQRPMINDAVRRANNARRGFAQLEDTVPDLTMKTQIIKPGDCITGVVVCDTRGIKPEIEGKFRVVISIDGENHEFTFSRSYN